MGVGRALKTIAHGVGSYKGSTSKILFLQEPTPVGDGRGTRPENHRPRGGLLQRQTLQAGR